MITLDFETYYDKQYSLGKLTTEQYIRSPLFEVIGLGYQIDDSEPVWVANHNGAVREALLSLNLQEKLVLAHNAAFDGAILSWHYGLNPKYLADTLSMAKPFHRVIAGGSLAALAAHYQLGSKGTAVGDAIGKRLADFGGAELADYGEYCKQDVRLTYKLFGKLLPRLTHDELHSINLAMQMYTDPQVELDVPLLQEYIETVRAAKQRVLEGVGVPRTVLMSNPQFAAQLETHGVTPPKKVSLTTGKETLALAKTDQGFQDLLTHENPEVKALAAARLAVKSTLAETRAESLIGVANRGRLPVMLNYYGAHTGRFSGGDKLNLQNFPKRGGDTHLRRAVMARNGHFIIASDLAQIEARIVAWLSGQSDLVELFADRRDVYVSFASKIFGKDEGDIDKSERFIGKTCILGLGYGMGAAKLKDTFRVMAALDADPEDCATYVKTYRDSYSWIKKLWATLDNALHDLTRGGGSIDLSLDNSHMKPILTVDRERQWIVLPNGLPVSYYKIRDIGGELFFPHERKLDVDDPSPEYIKDKWKKVYGGKCTENIVQALAALIMRWQMVQIHKQSGLRPVFQVHDELVYSVPQSELTQAVETIAANMRTVPTWAEGLPVDCEVSLGSNYGELNELKGA